MEQETKTVVPAEAEDDYIKMDWSLETNEERIKKVNEIIANTPSNQLNSRYLSKMADYIINTTTRKENKTERNILTENKMKNMNDRELSFEGLANRLENGEDGIYNMIANDKNILFTPKKGFTQDDIDNIPGLRELVDAIKAVDEDFKQAHGKQKYKLKKQLIEMQGDQYELKKMFVKPVRLINTQKSLSKLDLSEEISITKDGNVVSTGMINLYNPIHVSLLLCNYSHIKEECWNKFDSDMKWMIEDLENLIDKVFKEKHPYYYKLIIYKIDGKQNIEIQKLLAEEFNITHTVEYISALWRNKIPKMIAEAAAEEWILWHYTFEERGQWKRCSRCGQIKLANNRFFSKNSTSKDGYYSICKECRNKKKEKE